MSEIKKDKCRTCLKMNTKMHSLNTKPKMLEIDKTYMDLLKHIAQIEMDPEIECRVSQRVCGNCSKKIRDSYSFIQQVHKCHQYFVKLEESDALHEVPCINQDESFVKFLSEPKEKELRIESHVSIAINYTSNLASKLADHPTDTVELPNDNLSTDAKAENALQEATSIKQEEFINGPKKKKNSIESCSSKSIDDNSTDASHLADNTTDAVELVNDTLASDDKARNINENKQKRLNSECAANDAEIEDHLSGSSDNDTSSNYSSHEDPLDNEPNDETVPDTLEDEMLPVRCDICERVFSNSLLLNRHKKDTHLPDELKIQCPSCPVKFSRRYNMYAHMRTFHKSETVREHQLQPRKLTKTDVCDQCQRSYSDKYKLMAHIKNKHGPGSLPKKPKQPPKQYLCTLCGLTCTNKSNLEIHYRRRHTGEKPFKCDFCDRCFTRSYEVKVHRRTHTGEAPYKCTVCEKAFKRSNKLKIHMRIHTNERPYKCNECEKAFRESKDLNIHRRTHTGERPYKCSVCQSAFTQSNSLRLHQKNKKHFVDLSHAINLPLL